MAEITSSPQRLLNKQQGVRHILHAAIRLTFTGEDPFAVNMLGQSADKVLTDIMKHRKVVDPLSFQDRIVPERRNEFFRIYRGAFNFLKHADKDADGNFPVRKIVESNDLLLFANVLRYRALFSEFTFHMQAILSCVAILHPSIVKWDQMGEIGDLVTKQRKSFEDLTRAEFLEAMNRWCLSNGRFLKERAEDLIDVRRANELTLDGKIDPLSFRLDV